MREIKLYSFSELSETAKRKAVAENLEEIGADAKNYLLDIYNDHLGILSDAICGDSEIIEIDVDDDTNVVNIIIPMESALDFIGQRDTIEFKEWLTELKHKLYDENFFDIDAVSKIIDKHYNEAYPTASAFLLDLGNSISLRATTFYSNIKSNTNFVLDYFHGNVSSEYYFIAEDDILTNCEFLKDGTVVDIED